MVVDGAGAGNGSGAAATITGAGTGAGGGGWAGVGAGAGTGAGGRDGAGTGAGTGAETGAAAVSGTGASAGGAPSRIGMLAMIVGGGTDSSRVTRAAESSIAMKSRAVGSAILIGSSPLTSTRSPEYDPPTRRIIVTSAPSDVPLSCTSREVESSAGTGWTARTLSIHCCSLAASMSCAFANASRNPRPTKSSTTFAFVPRTHTR